MNATPDRRGLLLGALTAGAAATVVAVPDVAAAETPDAVFALLEVHRTALGRFEELDGSNHEAFTAAAATVDAALDEITSTPPTTVAGMRAVIEYLVGLDGHSDYCPPCCDRRSCDRRCWPDSLEQGRPCSVEHASPRAFVSSRLRVSRPRGRSSRRGAVFCFPMQSV